MSSTLQTQPNEKIIYVYKSYSPAQKKANKKYYERNKESLLEYHRNYKKSLYENDEQYRENLKLKQRERYHKKKEMLEANGSTS